MVDGVRGLQPPAGGVAAGAPGRVADAGADGFAAALARRDGTLAFSGHAMKRMEQRGLQLDETRMRRLEAAVQRAEAKGARDSLILLDELALVVSVTNHTVVTAVDEASTKEHVFTNIDSVVIAP